MRISDWISDVCSSDLIFIGAWFAMTGMPGMANHAPMKIGGATTAVGEDGKTLIVTLARPLTAGSYKVDWHAVAADTHRIVGSLTFTVRLRLDSSLVAIRWSLFSDLGLLFGLLLFAPDSLQTFAR